MDATTILDLVRMNKDMYSIHASYLSKFKGAVNKSNHLKDPHGPTPP